MKSLFRLLLLSAFITASKAVAQPQVVENSPTPPTALIDGEYESKLFSSIELVYEDDFNQAGPVNDDQWVIRQGTAWNVENGELAGSPSSKAFQQKKVAEGDKWHAGFMPVIFLKQVPAEFVVQMRVRYDGIDYMPNGRFPVLDLGHHIHTFFFSEKSSKLTLLKTKKVFNMEEQLLPINKWVTLTVELKKGEIFIQIDDKSKHFKHDLIDMGTHRQIDFRGVNDGGIRFDWVKVYKGNRNK